MRAAPASGPPVTEDYQPVTFTGRIEKMTIEITGMKAVDPESATQAVHEAHVRKQSAD